MARTPSAAVAAALLLVAALIACAAPRPAAAGGYGRGKPHRLGLYSPKEHYFNWTPAPAPAAANGGVPERFNWCDHEGQSYCTPSWNQHIPQYCGSCWAHATLHMVQDRLKGLKLRAGDTAPDVMLGRQSLLNCAGFYGLGDGCNGGEPLEVFKYMAEHGLPDESCRHYSASDHHVYKARGAKRCPTEAHCVNCMPAPTKKDPDAFECWGIKRPVMYKLVSYGKLEAGEAAMQAEILARGPIVCGIACPDVFTYHYHSSRRSGVFIDKSGDTELDHDVEVVGWGVAEDGTPYWEVRNSWGSYWGELGFFRVERGTNALQIESGDCWAAMPEYGAEQAVADGELEGSMDGLRRGKKAAPGGGGDDDHDDDGDDDADVEEEAAAAVEGEKDEKEEQQQQQQQRAVDARKAAERAAAVAVSRR